MEEMHQVPKCQDDMRTPTLFTGKSSAAGHRQLAKLPLFFLWWDVFCSTWSLVHSEFATTFPSGWTCWKELKMWITDFFFEFKRQSKKTDNLIYSCHDSLLTLITRAVRWCFRMELLGEIRRIETLTSQLVVCRRGGPGLFDASMYKFRKLVL